jgi:uncharacterized protein (TIGR02145 family)
MLNLKRNTTRLNRKMNRAQLVKSALILILIFYSCEMDENETQDVIRDIDGNVYTSVLIGDQIWMVENLQTTKFNDGSPIPHITDSAEWRNNNTPAYCWYDNKKIEYQYPYGALYNWYAVNTNKLCPTGWHVPSAKDWSDLSDFLGGQAIAGSQLKEVGTKHWCEPNSDATNQTGFTAVPGGTRSSTGEFFARGYFYGYSDCGVYGDWWTSTEDFSDMAIGKNLAANSSELTTSYTFKGTGYSVRCIKDN